MGGSFPKPQLQARACGCLRCIREYDVRLKLSLARTTRSLSVIKYEDDYPTYLLTFTSYFHAFCFSYLYSPCHCLSLVLVVLLLQAAATKRIDAGLQTPPPCVELRNISSSRPTGPTAPLKNTITATKPLLSILLDSVTTLRDVERATTPNSRLLVTMYRLSHP